MWGEPTKAAYRKRSRISGLTSTVVVGKIPLVSRRTLRQHVMPRSIGRIVMLATALLLALPPGWCCAAPPKPTKKPAAPPPVCCCCQQRQSADHTPNSLPPPVPPIRSCCHQDAVAPAAFKMPVEVVVAVLATDAAGMAILNSAACSLTDPEAFVQSPPLQILLCVWRC